MKTTMKTLLAALLLTVAAFGQTATTSTTLSVAITDRAQPYVVLASATNVSAGGFLYTDGEVMSVQNSYSSGTTVPVTRGGPGTRSVIHSSGATVYVFAPGNQARTGLINYDLYGACVRTDQTLLPRINSISGRIFDCYGSFWYFTDGTANSRYTLTIAPGAQPSATSPAAGVAIAITGQAGGAQSGTTSSGGAGAAITETGGAGGIGGSSSGTAGAGGATSLTGGAGGAGPITGGAGGTATLKGGAGGNGSSAGGSGGDAVVQAGAVGTGGTGAAGKVKVKDAADATKVVAIDASGLTTAVTNTLAFSATTAKTTTFPDITGTIPTVVSCGATSTGTANCANTTAAAIPRVYFGTATLGSNAQVITFGTAFTSTATYSCVANDITTRANVVQMSQTTASTATITNTTGASDAVNYICVGY